MRGDGDKGEEAHADAKNETQNEPESKNIAREKLFYIILHNMDRVNTAATAQQLVLLYTEKGIELKLYKRTKQTDKQTIERLNVHVEDRGIIPVRRD